MMSQTLKQNGSDKKQSDTFYLCCSLWGDKFESVSRLIDTDTVHLKSDRGSFGSVCIVSAGRLDISQCFQKFQKNSQNPVSKLAHTSLEAKTLQCKYCLVHVVGGEQLSTVHHLSPPTRVSVHPAYDVELLLN